MASSKYSYRFLAEPDSTLKCCICLEVAKGRPKQHGDLGCGKLFCEECIDKNGTKPCPMCRVENPKYFEDVRSLRDIKNLGVKCDNIMRGCLWEGTVGSFEDHLKRCDLTVVYCPNKCKTEGTVLLRRDMAAHLANDCPNRSYRCEHCGKEDTFAVITNVHSHLCMKKIVPCPNTGCLHSIEKEKLEDHFQNACEFAVVKCRYSSIGCSVKDIRKLILKHEAEAESHFQLSLQKISHLSNEVEFLKQEMLELKGVLKEATARLEAETVTLKDETVTLNDEMIALKRNTSTLINDVAILQDETASLRKEVDTLNRRVIAHISVRNFSLKKETNDEFLSEEFLTEPSGYKMILVVHPNGSSEGEGHYVSVYLEVMEVSYMEKLQWPFKANVKVELLNQLADKLEPPAAKKHITYIDSIRARLNEGWCCPKFVSHSGLTYNPARKTQYLSEDVLYFRVTVQESL